MTYFDIILFTAMISVLLGVLLAVVLLSFTEIRTDTSKIVGFKVTINKDLSSNIYPRFSRQFVGGWNSRYVTSSYMSESQIDGKNRTLYRVLASRSSEEELTEIKNRIAYEVLMFPSSAILEDSTKIVHIHNTEDFSKLMTRIYDMLEKEMGDNATLNPVDMFKAKFSKPKADVPLSRKNNRKFGKK